MVQETSDREVLICRGGPLDRVRLSVPSGLSWFELNANEHGDFQVADQVLGVVPIETVDIVWQLADRHRLDWQGNTVSKADIYVRQEFVTGEAGQIRIFAFKTNV